MAENFQPELIIAGLVLSLFGWTLYWAGLRLLGALCGGLAAGALAVMGALLGGAADPWVLAIGAVGAVLGGVLGVFLITRAHYFLFFVTGSVAGLAVAWLLETMYADWLAEHVSGTLGRGLFYGVTAIAAGVMILLAHRYIVIAVTAVAGSVLFGLGIPTRYAVWVILPLCIGSVLLQTGILSALGEMGRYDERYENARD
jgi:hypothetical protein